jgi:hypothetical protein
VWLPAWLPRPTRAGALVVVFKNIPGFSSVTAVTCVAGVRCWLVRQDHPAHVRVRPRIDHGCVWSQTGIPAAVASRTVLVLPGLRPRMNAAHPSRPSCGGFGGGHPSFRPHTGGQKPDLTDPVLSAWEVCGVVASSPADGLTCGYADGPGGLESPWLTRSAVVNCTLIARRTGTGVRSVYRGLLLLRPRGCPPLAVADVPRLATRPRSGLALTRRTRPRSCPSEEDGCHQLRTCRSRKFR